MKIQQGTPVTIEAAGTRQQLTSTVEAANMVYIEGASSNGEVYIGSSAVSSSAYIAKLVGRESWSVSIDGVEPKLDLTSLYVDTNRSGSKVFWGWA